MTEHQQISQLYKDMRDLSVDLTSSVTELKTTVANLHTQIELAISKAIRSHENVKHSASKTDSADKFDWIKLAKGIAYFAMIAGAGFGGYFGGGQ